MIKIKSIFRFGREKIKNPIDSIFSLPKNKNNPQYFITTIISTIEILTNYKYLR